MNTNSILYKILMSIERYLYIAVDSGTGDFSNVIYDAIYTGPVTVSIPYTSARVAIALV